MGLAFKDIKLTSVCDERIHAVFIRSTSVLTFEGIINSIFSVCLGLCVFACLLRVLMQDLHKKGLDMQVYDVHAYFMYQIYHCRHSLPGKMTSFASSHESNNDSFIYFVGVSCVFFIPYDCLSQNVQKVEKISM